MTNTTKSSAGFSDFEKEAMRERAEEVNTGKGNGEDAVLEKITAMQGTDKKIAQQLHKIIMKEAPSLTPKTWYGMPGYANKDGKVVIFFQDAGRFKARYLTLGFNDSANLDEGDMWPVSFAVKELTSAVEEKIIKLVKEAVS